MRNSARYVPGLRPGFAISTVKGIPDPERRLFDFLVSKLKPKSTDVLLYLLCMAGALAGYFLFAPPLSLVVIGLGLGLAVWSAVASDDSGKIVLRLGGLSWSMEDFLRGWLITGRTGSGKTQCGINTITFQLFQNVKNWGGVCLDQKGLYWEILVQMAAHFEGEHDLVLLQTGLRAKTRFGDLRTPSISRGRSRLDVCEGYRGYGGVIDRWARRQPFFPDQGATRHSDRF
jgi:hypothetical protein